MPMLFRAFCNMDVLVLNHSYGAMKTYGCVLYVSEISAHALCSDSRNFFFLYRIWAYE
jgi:hypothetical protein